MKLIPVNEAKLPTVTRCRIERRFFVDFLEKILYDQ